MNILFVDDYVMVLDGLRRMLRSMSGKWRMHFVTSANEALALLGKGHFDMIVTDVQMREVSGIELLKRVRDMFPHVIRLCCRAAARSRLSTRQRLSRTRLLQNRVIRKSSRT